MSTRLPQLDLVRLLLPPFRTSVCYFVRVCPTRHCACSVEGSLDNPGPESQPTSTDRIRPAAIITDLDAKQAAGIINWCVDTRQDRSTEGYYTCPRGHHPSLEQSWRSVSPNCVRRLRQGFPPHWLQGLDGEADGVGLLDVIIQWMYSFLLHRRQRIKVSNVMLDWAVMEAGMPQGSYLTPLTFVKLINKLHASCMMHMFVDDTTLTKMSPNPFRAAQKPTAVSWLGKRTRPGWTSMATKWRY